jgi:APA family basic amino acid/polyamine antiporter
MSEENRSSPGRPELPRVLGAWSAASILVGAIIGSGIFKKPGTVAAALGSPGWILFCWVAAGALALIGSLVFAELGSIYPRSGGQFTYLKESFGKVVAFLFGWTNLAIINSASIAALGVISAEFSFNLLPAEHRPEPSSHWYRTLPVLLIALLTTANVLGIRWGAWIQNVFTILKLAALAMIISAFLFPSRTDWSNLSPFWEIRGGDAMDSIWLGFKAAFLAIFWAYDGWYVLSFSGGEVRRPERNIPVGFVVGILVVITTYALFNLAIFGLVPLEEMSGVTRPGGVAAEAAYRLFGGVGLTLISIGIVCSTFGSANAFILTGPRLTYAMARDGLFFERFGDVHRRFLTPAVAIVVQGVLGAAYVYAGTFDQLTDSVVFAAWIFYLLTVIGYFGIRKRHAHRDDVFHAPGHPVLPLIFVVFATVFVLYSFVESFSLTQLYFQGSDDPRAEDGVYFPLVTLVILAGLPVYALVRHRRRQSP